MSADHFDMLVGGDLADTWCFRRYGYLLPAVFFGFVTAGMVFGAVASSLYIVDAHRKSIYALDQRKPPHILLRL